MSGPRRHPPAGRAVLSQLPGSPSAPAVLTDCAVSCEHVLTATVAAPPFLYPETWWWLSTTGPRHAPVDPRHGHVPGLGCFRSKLLPDGSSSCRDAGRVVAEPRVITVPSRSVMTWRSRGRIHGACGAMISLLHPPLLPNPYY